jgi:indolepyruvate ferredoxin oxidoreductase beta subunit
VVRGHAPTRQNCDKTAAASLRGFAAAFDAVSTPRAQAALVTGLLACARRLTMPTRAACGRWPSFRHRVHVMLALGHARLLDYRDADYAAATSSACRVLAAERADPAGTKPRHHARDGALAGAVDDLRRHRARGRTQEPASRTRACMPR